MHKVNETRDKEFFTEVRKLAGFLLPVEVSPTPPLNHEATARPLRQGVGGSQPTERTTQASITRGSSSFTPKVVNSKPLTTGAGPPPQSSRRGHRATPPQAV